MSINAINWAFNQEIKKSSAKLVLIALADYANDENVAYPSFTTLERKCSCSRTAIKDSIRFLIEKNFISKVDKDHIAPRYFKFQNCYMINVRMTNDNPPDGGKKITRAENDLGGRAENDPKPSCITTNINHQEKLSSSKDLSNACAREGEMATEPSASFSAFSFSDCEEFEAFPNFEFCEDDYQAEEEYKDLEFLAEQEKTKSKKISDIAANLFDDFVLDNSSAIESPSRNDNVKNTQTHAETKKDAETALKTQVTKNVRVHNETKQSVDMKIARADQKRQWRTSKAQGSAIVALVDLLEAKCTNKHETVKSIQAEWMDRTCFKGFYNFTKFMRCIETQLANNKYMIHKNARVKYDLDEKSEAMKAEARENCKERFKYIQANTAPKEIHSESSRKHFENLKKSIIGVA
jgi:hypothetical protein